MLFLVAGWAFAEAILFFLVVDVPISFIAVRRGWRAGVLAALVAALSAALGGAVTYGWAMSDPAGAAAAMRSLPAIDVGLIEDTSARFASHGYMAMFWGSLSGIPYKLYALAAGSGDASLLPFLLLSPIVRLPRFLLAALGPAALAQLVSRRLEMRTQLTVLVAFWILFYAWYFAVMPG